MSFILDALRKSEHARQRQSGPGLAEAPLAPTKPKSNVWATVAIALLVVNLLAVGVYLLRRAQNQSAPAAATTTTPVASPPAAVANPTLTSPPPTTTQAPVTQSAEPPTRAGADEPPGRNPLADEVGADGAGYEPSLESAAASTPAGPPAVSRNNRVKPGSVVYAPVPEGYDSPAAPPPNEAAVRSASPPADALPGADEMAGRGGMPALHLDLHVYAAQPTQRFIFVNSRKYREGDTLAEGPVVEQITAHGAVLSFQGSRFRLSND